MESVSGEKRQPRRAGVKLRLYPSPAQAEQLAQGCGACRALDNAALEQRIAAYRRQGVTLNSFSQNAGLTELLHDPELGWMREAASRAALKNALRDLDSAYAAFFAGRAGFPRFKRRGRGEAMRVDAGTYGFRRINRKWAEVRIPKIGWVRARVGQPIRGQLKGATILRDASGWHVAFVVELTGQAPRRPAPNPVGLDRGVAAAVATSTGDLHRAPRSTPGEERRRLKLERQLARQVRGSRRRARTVDQLAKLRRRQAARTRGFCHELTSTIAGLHDVVAIEALKTRNMTRSAKGTIEEPGRRVAAKAGLNRAILERSWGELERQLSYKLSSRGSTLIKVDPSYTSQTCSSCGHVAAGNRESQAVFSCQSCGHIEHADVNAAKVILARALDQEPAARAVVTARGGSAVGRPVKREGEGLAPQAPAVPASSAAAAAVDVDDTVTCHECTPVDAACASIARRT